MSAFDHNFLWFHSAISKFFQINLKTLSLGFHGLSYLTLQILYPLVPDISFLFTRHQFPLYQAWESCFQSVPYPTSASTNLLSFFFLHSNGSSGSSGRIHFLNSSRSSNTLQSSGSNFTKRQDNLNSQFFFSTPSSQDSSQHTTNKLSQTTISSRRDKRHSHNYLATTPSEGRTRQKATHRRQQTRDALTNSDTNGSNLDFSSPFITIFHSHHLLPILFIFHFFPLSQV